MNSAIPGGLTDTKWIHSHEEDQPGELVFRAASYPFPPSRGRSSFELKPDGTVAGTQPGPTDRAASRTGQWSLQDNDLVLSLGAGQKPQVLRIKSVEPDRLVVQR